jgi:hypothetical protein
VRPNTPEKRRALEAIDRHLDAAEGAAAGRPEALGGGQRFGPYRRIMAFIGGAAVERANSHLDAVETDLLRLAEDPYLRGALPDLVAQVRAHLPPKDPRRRHVEAVEAAVAERSSKELLDELDTERVLFAVRAATREGRLEIRRVRSFRNILLVTALFLSLGVGGLTLVGLFEEEVVPLCFTPNDEAVVCPTATQEISPGGAPAESPGDQTGAQAQTLDERMRETAGPWDIPVVEMVGLLAAALASAFSLRGIRGTSTPYSLPVALALLKLPAGALTAVLGLLLMRGGFVPGLSALDSSAQIIAWAVLFGYSQQIFTRLVDQQAKTVLENVGGPEQANSSAATACSGTPTTPKPA